MIRIKSDKIILGESLFDGYLYVDDGKIVDVTKDEAPSIILSLLILIISRKPYTS